MNIIFQIDGGIGKSVMATAVCKAIKKQYPEDNLIVITGYPNVFFCNPNVYKTLSHNDLFYFYQDNIQGQKVKAFLHNPYMEEAFINQEGHLIKIWCEMFGIIYNGELPELFINKREREFLGTQFVSDKPIMIIQTNGGGTDQPNKYSWMRDIPIATAQKVVDHFAAYYTIVHIRREDQLQLNNTVSVHKDFRSLATLIHFSAKRLLIDSFAQHVAAALRKQSVVCWIGNKPEQFGYNIHTNIMALAPTIKPEMRHSVFTKYNMTGQITEFPYNNEHEIFDADSLIAVLEKEHAEDKITAQHRNSMVARRLMHLIGKTDLDNVQQILDIGSWHLGQSIEFSNIFPEAKINAFEPIPDSYELCLKNHKQLPTGKKEKIQVHNIAINSTTGEVPFYVIDTAVNQNIDKGFSSLLRFDEGVIKDKDIQKEIMVQADTLDNWCTKNSVHEVDIMWVDAQGAELSVFQGGHNILQRTKVIMTEVGLKPYYEGHTLKADIDTYLSELGFSELKTSFEYNIPGYEANTIYIKNH